MRYCTDADVDRFCGVERRPSSKQTAFYRRMSSRAQQGDLWLQQQAMERVRRIAIPLKVEPLPPDTLRIILPANGQAAIHDTVEEAQVCGTRGCGDVAVGVDKGCTEVHLDRDGERHKARLGNRLSAESDHRKVQGRRRNRLRVVVENHVAKGRHRKPTPSGRTTWATGSGNGGSPCTTDRCATISVRQPIPWWTRPAPSPARTCPHPCSPPRTAPVA